MARLQLWSIVRFGKRQDDLLVEALLALPVQTCPERGCGFADDGRKMFSCPCGESEYIKGRWFLTTKGYYFLPVLDVFPHLIAADFLAVQPMKEPSAKLFYEDYLYGPQ